MTPEEKNKSLEKCLNEIINISKKFKGSKLRQAVCKILKKNIPYYNWVGFYLSDGNETLILHEFEGEPTIHTKIRYGEGICGQAAVSNKTFLVPDVTKEQNYLSCSVKVKSEIVVPLLRDGNFSGELDIDSHTINAFDENDRIFLEKICDIIVQNI